VRPAISSQVRAFVIKRVAVTLMLSLLSTGVVDGLQPKVSPALRGRCARASQPY
jgi:hypothetical protein